MAADPKQKEKNKGKKKEKSSKNGNSSDSSEEEYEKQERPKNAPKLRPSVPQWGKETKKYIASQLQNYPYFKKRPYLHMNYESNDETSKESKEKFEKLYEIAYRLLENKKGDFCWSLDWDAYFLSRLIYYGFLTISTEIQENVYIMLPKLHHERCICDLSNMDSIDLSIDKSKLKQSGKHFVTINSGFYQVFQECINQHGESWLHPPMQACLMMLHENKDRKQNNGVQCYSIEVWNASGELVSGELGTCLGSIYTSLTGFYKENHGGSGTIQLWALKSLLIKYKFKLWDLGMYMKYKSIFGGKKVDRSNFVKMYSKYRNDENIDMNITQNDKMNIKRLILDTKQQLTRNDVSMNEEKEKEKEKEHKHDNGNNDNCNGNRQMSKNEMKRLAKAEKREKAKQAARLKREKQNNNQNNKQDSIVT